MNRTDKGESDNCRRANGRTKGIGGRAKIHTHTGIIEGQQVYRASRRCNPC